MNESKFTLIYIGLKYILAVNSGNVPVTGVSLTQHISISVTANTGQATASLVWRAAGKYTTLSEEARQMAGACQDA